MELITIDTDSKSDIIIFIHFGESSIDYQHSVIISVPQEISIFAIRSESSLSMKSNHPTVIIHVIVIPGDFQSLQFIETTSFQLSQILLLEIFTYFAIRIKFIQ